MRLLTVVTSLLIAWPVCLLAQMPDDAEFQVDGSRSWIRVQVYRAGILAGLGHNHTVHTEEISGTIVMCPDLAESSAAIEFSVSSLQVDNPEQRLAAGEDFAGDVKTKDVNGTEKNLFGRKLLNAEQFPLISAETVSLSGSLEQLEVAALLVIRDERWPIDFAASVTLEGQQLAIDGQIELLHTDMGLTPFSAGFGTLKVSDALILVFHLVATRDSDLP